MCDFLGAAEIPTSELWVFQTKQHFDPPLTAKQIGEHMPSRGHRARGLNPIIHHLHSKEDSNPARWLWTIIEHTACERVAWFYLDRYDRVRQAVSFERALYLQEWLSFDAPKDASDMPYDQKQITNRIEHLDYQARWWHSFFSIHDIDPIRLFYEDFVTDIPGTMRQVFYHIGIGEWIPGVRHRQKQAHEDVEPHVQRYYQHLLMWKGLWSKEGKR